MAKFYSAYALPDGIPTICSEPSLTQQHFADEVNINNILLKYINTGNCLANGQQSMFFDTTIIPDTFQGMQDALLDATDKFYHLPLNVRDRFKNDPSALLDFIYDSANKDEAISLGLIEAPIIVSPPDTPPEG